MTALAPFFSESGSSPPSLDDPRLPNRIREKIAIDPSTGCWVWVAARSTAGYGRVRLGGQTRNAHRVVYELLVGPIPKGLVLDHIACDSPACCNPAHLRVTTNAENLRRGWARVHAGLPPSTSEAARRGMANREKSRRHHERMAAEGRCQSCGSPEMKTETLCSRCVAVKRESDHRRQAELIAAGLCAQGCGRTLAPDSKWRCEPCLAKERERDRRRRAQARIEERAA